MINFAKQKLPNPNNSKSRQKSPLKMLSYICELYCSKVVIHEGKTNI